MTDPTTESLEARRQQLEQALRRVQEELAQVRDELRQRTAATAAQRRKARRAMGAKIGAAIRARRIA